MKSYMVLFFTHSGAIKFQRKLKGLNVSCKLMPVPRALSSNCGIGARVSHDGDILILTDNEVEKVYEIRDNDYREIFHQS
ncbi:DUF3343 domain-containing protein [Gudongella sp. SC589]|uniref:DUF3343 domain-containing protein n=1 Tax=Gudongella sp. SC589 TaxID=3385990 RepID=UPI00390489AF